LAAFAAGKANVALQLVEDLKFVLIGKGILDRGSGPYYIRNTPGARGGSGFQESLRDGSPQVEHAMAAIYLGRGEVPAGMASALAAFTEALGEPPTRPMPNCI